MAEYHRFGSGSPSGQLPFAARLLGGYQMRASCRFHAQWVAPLLLGMAVGALLFFAGIKIALGSCTMVPELRAETRARLMCIKKTRGKSEDCSWRVKRTFPIEIIPMGHTPETAFFTLIIKGLKREPVEIGTFPISDAIPIDLDTLDVAKIDQALFMRMGGDDVQAAIEEKIGPGTFWINQIVEWIPPPPDCPDCSASLAGTGVWVR